MSDTSDKTSLLDWFRAWPWPEQSGETLGDEECEVIRRVILERDALQARLAAAEAMAVALGELTAMVKGECPSLLNEDSGGDGMLAVQIDAARAAWEAAQ